MIPYIRDRERQSIIKCVNSVFRPLDMISYCHVFRCDLQPSVYVCAEIKIARRLTKANSVLIIVQSSSVSVVVSVHI